MDPSSSEPSPDSEASRSRSGVWWLAAIGVIAALVAGFAFVRSGADDPVDAAPSTTIPRLSDLAATAPGDEELAPGFVVPTLDGGTFSLTEHLSEDGRPVFLNLWASWCFPCREEMPDIDAAAMAHPGVLFVGVAVADDNDAAAEFARSIGVRYTIAFDRDHQVEDGYPVLGMPGSFLIDSDGTIVKTVFGGVDEAEIEELLAEAFGV